MSGLPVASPTELKQELRKHALATRRRQPQKDAFSREIVGRVLTLPEYSVAQTVLWYVDVRSEVRTRHHLSTALASGKQIIVPWCNDAEVLELFHLESLDELSPGKYQVLEPKAELRNRPEKQVDPGSLDFVLVPGVAFDSRGGRLGHGKGYYDKLLSRVRPDAALVALAFACQMFDAIPVDPHDVLVHWVVTEEGVFNCARRTTT